MKDRPTWSEYFLRMASLVATRGTCERLQVGAVLVNKDRRVVATGYNGAPRAMAHCPGQDQCVVQINGRASCARALHAESNAIDDAGRNAMGCSLYCTHFPCFDCAKRIVNAGVAEVFYEAEYTGGRSGPNAMDLFADAGITVSRLSV